MEWENMKGMKGTSEQKWENMEGMKGGRKRNNNKNRRIESR